MRNARRRNLRKRAVVTCQCYLLQRFNIALIIDLFFFTGDSEVTLCLQLAAKIIRFCLQSKKMRLLF